MVAILLRYPIKIKSRQNNSQLTKNYDLIKLLQETRF